MIKKTKYKDITICTQYIAFANGYMWMIVKAESAGNYGKLEINGPDSFVLEDSAIRNAKKFWDNELTKLSKPSKQDLTIANDGKKSKYTKFMLDTEFNEDGRVIDLISIGIVCENGSKYYAVSKEFAASRCNDWVKANVLPNLYPDGCGVNGPRDRKTRAMIAREIKKFVTDNTYDNTKPEFWGYYADYDWVVLCQLFGAMIKLPKNFPMFCMDLNQSSRMLGREDLPEQDQDNRGYVEHNALHDAMWNVKSYKYIYGV